MFEKTQRNGQPFAETGARQRTQFVAAFFFVNRLVVRVAKKEKWNTHLMKTNSAQARALYKSRPSLPPRPVTFRLPKPGLPDPFFGFTRAFYYEGQKRGWWKLLRICAEGKSRGVTVINFDEVAKFVEEQQHTGGVK